MANMIAGDCRNRFTTIATIRPITPMMRNDPQAEMSFFVV